MCVCVCAVESDGNEKTLLCVCPDFLAITSAKIADSNASTKDL